MERTYIENIHQCTDENIRKCAENIQKGNVVVFPTETVYGIGACALNEDAVKKIYEIKKRPSDNPLIIHVLGWSEAQIYVNIDNNDKDIVKTLVDQFWPGPLTILLKKNEFIPDIVTAGSKWVALRSPSNKHTRKLLEFAMVPIAAPSANISGQVTSTSKHHILRYFGESDIDILIDDKPCVYGTESTIVKIENNNIVILRPGIITKEAIEKSLVRHGNLNITDNTIIEQGCSPGTNLTHYTTSKNTLLFNFMDIDMTLDDNIENINRVLMEYLNKSACIDFGMKNHHLRNLFGAYVDLSKNSDIKEGIFNYYNVLHQLEELNIENIMIFDNYSNRDGLYKTLFDRMYRSCSGKKILVPLSMLQTA